MFGKDPRKRGVVDKIEGLRADLKDPTKIVERERFALGFLAHLVEGIHMPCHVADNHDRAGNDTQIRFFHRGSNMHTM
ncbi:MAG: S1/P1 nuclease [Fimbriimonadales bacterium]